MTNCRIDVSKPDQNGRTGVTIHDDKAWQGYTLVWSRGHESARLLDMEGRIVHTWQARNGVCWHDAKMLDSGSLLVVANWKQRRQFLLELDWNSEVVRQYHCPAHHDARRLDNGNTLAICNARAHYRALSPRPILYDYLLELTPDGDTVWEWHFAAHAEEIRWEGATQVGQNRDWPHINTVQSLPDTPLGRRDARFKAGNVLISPRHMHRIVIIEKETGRIVWCWGDGVVVGQHQPTLLDTGRMLIFDNGWGPPLRGWSRVIEIEPTTGEIVWEYRADPPTEFWTPVGSGAQRLPNGNTLICAMNWNETGRVFEVTPEGETVWEYWNGEAESLYRSERYSPETVEPLMQAQ